MEAVPLCGVSYLKKQAWDRVCMHITSFGKSMKGRVRNEQKKEKGGKSDRCVSLSWAVGAQARHDLPWQKKLQNHPQECSLIRGLLRKVLFSVKMDSGRWQSLSPSSSLWHCCLSERQASLATWRVADMLRTKVWEEGEEVSPWWCDWATVIQPGTFLPLDFLLIKGVCFPGCSGRCGLDLQSHAAETTLGDAASDSTLPHSTISPSPQASLPCEDV